MNWQQKLREWQSCEHLDSGMKDQLKTLSDPAELEERFYKYLSFGTGGMRGELGVGINRINDYTIKRVALGLAQYISEAGASQQGVVISYDNCHGSQRFAKWTARVLASQGVKVYLSDQLRPTPQLSFLVRYYHAFAGVMITASHNPKEYNGFKVYGSDGGQITLAAAERLLTILNEIQNELAIEAEPLSAYVNNKIINLFGEEVDTLYLEKLALVSQNPAQTSRFGSNVSIVYSPLHGSGNILVQKAFQKLGFTNLRVIKEQAVPDPDFSTVMSPNPEDEQAFALALDEAAVRPAQLILATDPDADRLGAVVIKNGEPIFLNGNQIGVLILDYIIRSTKEHERLKDFFIAKTIVTSDLGEKIAAAHGIETRNTLTGFKFIGEQIQLSEAKEDKHFLFGYEESFGYLAATFVRDKDAIQAAILLAETALSCFFDGIDLIDRLNDIYEQYGYYAECLETQMFPGKDGLIQMNRQLDDLRSQGFIQLDGFELLCKEDYLSSERWISDDQKSLLTLPSSNVLKYIFKDGSWLCLRPSGTEPKFKIYYSVHGKSKVETANKLENLKAAFHRLIKK